MKKGKSFCWTWKFILIVFMIFAVALGALLFDKLKFNRLRPTTPAHSPKIKSQVSFLFFTAPEGRRLVREERKIDTCINPVQYIETLLAELIKGPVSNLRSTLPPNVIVHSVKIEGKMARIDLGREITEELPHGSFAEMAAIYSIVNTITLNIPQVRQVSFLIDGSGVDTLLGHLDLRQPLTPNFTMGEKE